MSEVKLITLDLDNTLWDVDSIIIAAEADMVQWLETHVPDSLQHYNPQVLPDIRQQVFSEHAARAHDLSFMRIQVLCEVMLRTGLSSQAARRTAQQAFDVFYEGRNRVKFFPGAIAMLETLSRQFDIYTLTNGNANIHKAGLSEYVSGAFSSADVGKKKPHADMFHAPLKVLSLKPAQAIHIGDHLVDDIEGAANVGMHSIWVNLNAQQTAPGAVTPTREVTNLHAVAPAVTEIISGL
jgi:FMN hydrolase / 5-amino-6-(5-phospho-D-ribitylamino)uracil phosphatase